MRQEIALIVSDENEMGAYAEEVVQLNSFDVADKQISLPRYLEDNAERLREKYLKFIYDLSCSNYGTKSIIDHLEIELGLSYWWMTTIAEKSPFKSPAIYNCLRIIALEEIILGYRPQSILLIAADKKLAKSIKVMCKDLNIKFTWNHKAKNKPIRLRSIYNKLPYFFQGLISLRHLILRWTLKRVNFDSWHGGKNSITICSYFFNLKAESENVFYSNQWGPFPELLREYEIKINWLQLYLPSSAIPTPKSALFKINQFNQHPQSHSSLHKFVESYISLALVYRIIKRWLVLTVKFLRLRGISANFKIKNSAVWLWPLLESDWKSSMIGPNAISNCIWLELFDAALGDIPFQKLGFYLWENQGWESAFLWAWKRHGHGTLVGVPHATICFWHLNNFEYSKSYLQNSPLSKSMPNFLAVNGNSAYEEFLKCKYPFEKLKKVEALRFMHLQNYVKNNNTKIINQEGEDPGDLLLIGDFNYEQTLKMLKLISETSLMLGRQINVTLKPHPACKTTYEVLPGVILRITNEPIEKVAKCFHFSFVGNSSSAALDALMAGLYVAIFIDGEDFNQSPLRSSRAVEFVTNSKELSNFLGVRKNASDKVVKKEIENFFWLDEDLQRWNSFLSELDVNEKA